jgi:hypothetical protein
MHIRHNDEGYFFECSGQLGPFYTLWFFAAAYSDLLMSFFFSLSFLSNVPLFFCGRSSDYKHPATVYCCVTTILNVHKRIRLLHRHHNRFCP